MTFTRRFPAAARLVVEGAIDGALRRLRDGQVPAFGLDEQEKGELEVTVAPVEEAPACAVDFDQLRIAPESRTEKVRVILGLGWVEEGSWCDEQPIAAHGVADEDDLA